MEFSPPKLPTECVPAAVRGVLADLSALGHPSVLVGGCVRDLLQGCDVHDFDIATPATPEDVVAFFPHAVPIGLRFGTVMIPTDAGPVDVTTFRGRPALDAGTDRRLAEDLAHRDYTLNALAWRPDGGELIDLHGGLEDLASKRLRAVGSADDRLAEDPLRALRGVRLFAERGFTPDAPLEQAMSRVAARLVDVPGERLRPEIERILLSSGVERGLQLLRRTGIEAVIAPGVDEHAATRVAGLPCIRDARLAGWLLSTTPQSILARLRCSRPLSERVDRVIRAHPILKGIDLQRPSAIRRILHRFAPDEIELLVTLAELAEGDGSAATKETRKQAARLRAAVEQARSDAHLALHRHDLALDGEAIMSLLGCEPGPVIGEALRYLTDCVLDDPTTNTPDGLRLRLRAWAERR